MAKDRRLVVFEANDTDPDYGCMFALAPGDASGVPLPTFNSGPALPAAGTMKGEAFYDEKHQQGFIWNGTAWRPISPTPIHTYATEALLKADISLNPGTYATAGDTGNLFIRRGAGWMQVGIAGYATVAALLKETPLQGSLGEALDDGSLWEMTASGWRALETREMADTAAVSAWSNPGNAVGLNGCNNGDRALARDVDVAYIRTPSGWRPTTIWEAPDAATILAATWALDGQEAVDLATGHAYVRRNGDWVQDPIHHYSTETLLRAATPPEGTLAWADDTGKVFARHNSGWIGLITGCDDPIPVGAIMGFPTTSAPGGWLICDGSAIPAGARFDELRTLLAPATTVPDLRGQFLRGGGATDTLLTRIGWKTARPRQDFTTNSPVDIAVTLPITGTAVLGGAHTHGYLSGHGSTSGINGGTFHTGEIGYTSTHNTSDSGGDHTHTLSGNAAGRVTGTVVGTVNGGGDSETVPDHVKVIYYIKAYRLEISTPTGTLPTTIGSPTGGQVLGYDATTSTWTNQNLGKMKVQAAAPGSPAVGESWYNTTKHQLEIWDGTAWKTSGAEDPRFREGDVTLGANAVADSEIILIKKIVPTNDGVYVSIVDANTSAEHQSIALHIFTSNMTSAAPMRELHSHNAGAKFSQLRYYWKDATDAYVVVGKLIADSANAVFRVGMMSPTADLSGIEFDGNTVSTVTGGSVIKPGGALDPHHFTGKLTLGAGAVSGASIKLIKNVNYDNSSVYISVVDETDSGDGSTYELHLVACNGAAASLREIHSNLKGNRIEKFCIEWTNADKFYLSAKFSGDAHGRTFRIGMMSQTGDLSKIILDGSSAGADTSIAVTPGNYDYSTSGFTSAVKSVITAEAPKVFPVIRTPGKEDPDSSGNVTTFSWRNLVHGMRETWFGYAGENWNQILYFQGANGKTKHFYNTIQLLVGGGAFEKYYDDVRTAGSNNNWDYWFHWGDDNNKVKANREVTTDIQYFNATPKNTGLLFITSRYRRAGDDKESILWCRMEFDQAADPITKYALNGYSGDHIKFITVN